jgi:hypothetical protein
MFLQTLSFVMAVFLWLMSLALVLSYLVFILTPYTTKIAQKINSKLQRDLVSFKI